MEILVTLGLLFILIYFLIYFFKEITIIALLLGGCYVIYICIRWYNSDEQRNIRAQEERTRKEAEERLKREEIYTKIEIQQRLKEEKERKHQEWLKQCIVPKVINPRTPDINDNIAKAGDIGEEILANAFKTHGNFQECFWWLNKRIKRELGEQGPNEIDLIVISHNYIYLLESKYYRGNLLKNPNKWDKVNPWIIVKPAREVNGRAFSNTNTKVETLPDIFGILNEKKEKLRLFLSEKGVHIPDEIYKAKVVFTHKEFEIDEKINNDKMISINDLDSYIDSDRESMNDVEHFIISLIRYIIYHEGNKESFVDNVSGGHLISLLANLKLIESINYLPSWDTIIFYGGKQIKGDILQLRTIFGDQSNVSFLNEKCDLKINSPREPDAIRLAYLNNKDLEIEVIGQNGKTISWNKINCSKPMIRFHKVGSDKPEMFYIYEIEKIILRGLYHLGYES